MIQKFNKGLKNWLSIEKNIIEWEKHIIIIRNYFHLENLVYYLQVNPYYKWFWCFWENSFENVFFEAINSLQKSKTLTNKGKLSIKKIINHKLSTISNLKPYLKMNEKLYSLMTLKLKNIHSFHKWVHIEEIFMKLNIDILIKRMNY